MRHLELATSLLVYPSILMRPCPSLHPDVGQRPWGHYHRRSAAVATIANTANPRPTVVEAADVEATVESADAVLI